MNQVSLWENNEIIGKHKMSNKGSLFSNFDTYNGPLFFSKFEKSRESFRGQSE